MNDTLESPIDCALRETHEELGNDIGPIRIIGQCEEIPAKTGTLVTPVLAFIENDVGDFENFVPSDGEVDRIFTRSVEYLLDPRNSTTESYTTKSGAKFTMPVFGHSDEKERIWGLTAVILKSLLDKAIVPTII